MTDAAEKAPGRARPEFRNIHVTQIVGYRMPLAAIVSILHRISGVGIFLLLPFLLFLLDRSLGSPETFQTFAAVVDNWFVKLILLGLLWAYMHHFCAGIRFLLLDMHMGVDLESARKSSKIVIGVSLALTLIIGVKLW